jgi:cytochrome oxidase Cu insertion factor (SCO1/SenC/PrrC family)
MGKKNRWIIVVMLVILLSACTQEAKPEVEVGYFPGNKAPDFTLESLSGETISLSDYSGKSVLLVFWASW